MRAHKRHFAALLLAVLLLIIPTAATDVNAKTVRVAVCPHTPPFQFLDESHHLSGIHIDIMDSIAQQNNLSVIYTTYNTKSECISALDRGIVDIVLGYQTQEYEKTDHLVTSELSNASISIVANKNLADYIAETDHAMPFAITFEYGVVDYSLLHSLGFHRLLGVGNQEQAMDALISQRVDISVGINESIDYILCRQDAEKDFKIVHGQVGTIRYAILVGQSSPSLYRTLDRALVELHTSGAYEDIFRRWVQDRTEEQLRLIEHVLVAVASVTLLITAAALWFNYLLRKKVSEKTKMLHAANQSLERTVIKLENEAVFRNQTIDSLPVGAILFDMDFSITLMNPMACAICGFQIPDRRCRDARQLPVFGWILQQLDGDIFSAGPQVEQKQVFAFDSGASKLNYRCWLRRLAGEEHFAGVLMMVENITQEEHRRRELFAMEKANTLNKVVAGIAHEIRNPLMTIKTAVSLMATRWEDPEVKKAFIQFIPDEVDKMNGMVESLLNYAKPPNEEFSVFRLSETTTRSFNLARMADSKSRIRFAVTVDDDLYIRGQRDLLRQALTNLLINGMWAVNKKGGESQVENWSGSITGHIYADGTWVCLSIHDDGVGMSADVLNRCTEPFFTTKLAGTGLGLALAKQCVESSSGVLSIRSEENRYTEILIRFPRLHPE